MTTWAQLRADVRGLIQDDLEPYIVSESLLLRYANYATSWVASRHPRNRRAVVPVTEGLLQLPSDCLHPVAVYASSQHYELLDLSLDGPVPGNGQAVRLDDVVVAVGKDAYGQAVTEASLFYLGSYPTFSADDDLVPVPQALEEAVLYYTASRALSQRAAQASNLDQFDQRTDSGNPESNPHLKVANFYLAKAREVLDTYTPR